MYKILALHGGGIRGVITARVLASLEKYTGKLCHELFDLVAGTSTGGILACLIGLGMPMAKAEEIYSVDGPIIFKKRFFLRTGLCIAKYPKKNIESILMKWFKETRLKDSMCDILVPAFDHVNNTACIMTSSDARVGGPANLQLWRVARRTSSAPVYFPSAEGQYHDGGVFANNPSLCALAEALKTHTQDKIQILTIGTGDLPQARKLGVGHEGAMGILPNLSSIFMNAGSDAIDYICQMLLQDRYMSIQTDLTGISPAMDDASTKHISQLQAAADRRIQSIDWASITK